MARSSRAAVLAFGILASGASAAFAQVVVDLSQTGPAGTAIQWVGDRANARLGTSILRADMSGDIDREDLIAGAPGAGPNSEGQAYIVFMGPPHSGTVTAAGSASAIVTGEAA